MPVQFDKFDQQKVDNIHSHLEGIASKGAGKNYEIFVDGLKAVTKTNDPGEFFKYENYLSENTNDIKIVLYGTGTSPRNDQYVFSMKAKSQQEALDQGLDGFTTKSYSKKELEELKKEKDKKTSENEELETLRKKVVEQEKEIADNKIYTGTLEDAINKAKSNANKIGGYHIGEIMSVFFEGLVRRNKDKIVKIPGLEGLAGFLDDESEPTPEGNKSDSEATFKKKDPSSNGVVLTEQEKEFIKLFNEIVKVFSPQEIDEIIKMLHSLSKDKSQLKPILELLQETKK